MIAANVRSMLRRDDAQLVLRLVSHGSHTEYERAEEVLRDQGFEALLDDPRLPAILTQAPQGSHASYPLFTYVIVRHAMRAVGEDDRLMADYVASILFHFGLRQRALQVSDADDEQFGTLAEILGATEVSDPRRAWLARAHLGNYALWQSGMFPDHVAARHWRRGAPDIDYYEEMGRQGFRMAAEHRLSAESGLAPVYSAACERFGLFRIALNRVSDTYLFPNVNSPDRVMRQVRDAMRLAA